MNTITTKCIIMSLDSTYTASLNGLFVPLFNIKRVALHVLIVSHVSFRLPIKYL